MDQKKLELKRDLAVALGNVKRSLAELKRLKRMGGTEEGRWRLVHAATGMEMFLARGMGMKREPEHFAVMWRRPPGADFTRREAMALGSAYIAVTGDHRVSLEPMAEGGGGEAPPGDTSGGEG